MAILSVMELHDWTWTRRHSSQHQKYIRRITVQRYLRRAVPTDRPLASSVELTGRLQEVTMQRYGKQDVEDWQSIPYGFSADRE